MSVHPSLPGIVKCLCWFLLDFGGIFWTRYIPLETRMSGEFILVFAKIENVALTNRVDRRKLVLKISSLRWISLSILRKCYFCGVITVTLFQWLRLKGFFVLFCFSPESVMTMGWKEGLKKYFIFFYRNKLWYLCTLL